MRRRGSAPAREAHASAAASTTAAPVSLVSSASVPLSRKERLSVMRQVRRRSPPAVGVGRRRRLRARRAAPARQSMKSYAKSRRRAVSAAVVSRSRKKSAPAGGVEPSLSVTDAVAIARYTRRR